MTQNKLLQLRVDNPNRIKSIVGIEYGQDSTKRLRTFYRIRQLLTKTFLIPQRRNLKKFVQILKRRPFSKFIVSSGEYIKKRCFDIAAKKAELYNRNLKSPKRFIVVHLRGTDRPCAFERLKPKDLIFKLEKTGLKRTTDVVYVMTDLTSNSSHFIELKKYFKNYYMFQASDMELFDHSIFAKKAAFLLYATELQLQEMADGIVETYANHKMRNYKNVWGYLAPKGC